MASNTDNTDIVQQILSHLQSLNQPDYGAAGAIGGALGAFTNGNNVSSAYNDAATSAQNQANTLQAQMNGMPTLESMYGQNSPYALQMQKTLAAKDAASGRNSQYGQRAQALQADLASKGSTYAAQQAQSAQAYNNALNQANNAHTAATNNQAQVQAQQLNSLFNVGQKTGLLPSLNSMTQPYADKINSGLSNLFGNSNTGAPQQPMDQSPYGGGGNYSGYTTGSDQNNMGTQPYQSNQGMGQMYGPGNDYVNPDNSQTYQQPTGTDLYDQN